MEKSKMVNNWYEIREVSITLIDKWQPTTSQGAPKTARLESAHVPCLSCITLTSS